MKKFNRFMNEKKWEPTGLLQNMGNTRREDCAAVLEGQRLSNESLKETTTQWRRVSIPIVYRLFVQVPELKGSDTPLSNWIETGLNPDDFLPEESAIEGKDCKDSLDKEAEGTATLTDALANWVKKNLAEGKFDTLASVIAVNGQLRVNVE